MPSLNTLMETKFSALPGPVRDLINDPTTLDFIEKLGSNANLDDYIIDMLIDEVGYVLFKETPVDSFTNNLQVVLGLSEEKSNLIGEEIHKVIFNPVIKFLKRAETKSIFQTSKPVENEDINHHELLDEIENPTPSIKPTLENTPHGDEKPVSAVTIMPKDAQKLMTQVDTLPTETTHAPDLQEAVAQIMPHVGGFKPLDNPLKPTEKVVGILEDKLTSVVKTPVKEVYVPKKPDPYREPIA